MTYARIEKGTVAEYPVYEGDIRLRFPSTSFPVPFEPPADYVLVEDRPAPEVDHTKTVIDADPELVDGAWVRQWAVLKATKAQITERTELRAAGVRRDREALLAASDWTQLADAPVDAAAWATYRQSLRDVTKQAGFPWDVRWPDAP